MAMTASATMVDQIGEVAGVIWHLLDETGPLPLTQVVKEVDAPRDVIMQGIGWLAREEKLVIEEEGRRKIATLV